MSPKLQGTTGEDMGYAKRDDETRGQEEGGVVWIPGKTHTHRLPHRGKDQRRQSLPPTAATRTSGKDQASTRLFSPSYHEASAERGWVKVAGLCLQGALALGQGGFDGGHQLQKLAFCVHVAIAFLLRVNQLPGYHYFKEPGGLGSSLAADVQAAGELIF